MSGMCLNWKVLAGLAVAGLGVLVVAPHLALSVLPVLLFAACPLSMLFMMRGMGQGKSCGTTAGAAASDPIGTSQGHRIAQLEAEIQRLRVQRDTPDLGAPESRDSRYPVLPGVRG